MALTKFGKELRKICIDHDINRAKLAKSIGMKPGDLASVEHGKTDFPSAAFKKLLATYAVDQAKEWTLRNALRNSASQVVFDVSSMSEGHRNSVFDLKDAIRADIELDAAEAKQKAKLEREQRADAKVKADAKAKAKAVEEDKNQTSDVSDELDKELAELEAA